MQTVRSQVYLEATQRRRLKDLARERGVTVSSLLREIIEEYLQQRRPRKSFTRDDYLSIVDLGDSQPGGEAVRVAEEPDRYIVADIVDRKLDRDEE